MPFALIAFGANIRGPWGEPAETLRRARQRLRSNNLKVIRTSRLYKTLPVGLVRQPAYFNAVSLIQTDLTPTALLTLAKSIERAAGRRPTLRWGPRPLDIDIIDYHRAVVHWNGKPTRPGLLALPHPSMHRRAFVLAPLCEVAPEWRHPRLGQTARSLLMRLTARDKAGLVPLEGNGDMCDE